ncbi:hypothetical protein C4D60_Mb05t20690 [Musa balbisiana]|uniref:Uncharacterized protein n=1 Tax=Musa balbisiana TaxID=52838 RepID=A0A4S8JXM1_MUSBA|nr:hypothetical protein C4D60_Mb05t20690 [Musa balbisiana]
MAAPTDLLVPDLLLLIQFSLQFSVRIVKDKTKLLMVREEEPQVRWNKWMQVEIIDVSGLLIPVTMYHYLILDQVFQNLDVGIWSQEAYPLKVWKKSVEGLHFPKVGRIDKEAPGVCLEEVISSL